MDLGVLSQVRYEIDRRTKGLVPSWAFFQPIVAVCEFLPIGIR